MSKESVWEGRARERGKGQSAGGRAKPAKTRANRDRGTQSCTVCTLAFRYTTSNKLRKYCFRLAANPSIKAATSSGVTSWHPVFTMWSAWWHARERNAQATMPGVTAGKPQASSTQTARKQHANSKQTAGKQQASSRHAAGKQQASSRQAAGKQQASSRQAAGKQQASSRQAAGKQQKLHDSAHPCVEVIQVRLREQPHATGKCLHRLRCQPRVVHHELRPGSASDQEPNVAAADGAVRKNV